MSAIRRLLVRLGNTLRRRDAADDDLRAELEAHLRMQIEENLGRGMTSGEARRRALIESGGLLQAAEAVRAQRGLPWIESFFADARFAVRHFRRTPLATATILLVLSLGIGTNVVVFTILNSLATLPAPGLERDDALVRIRGTESSRQSVDPGSRLLSWPEIEDYAGRTDVFAGVAAYAEEAVTLDLGTAVLSGTAIHATPNYFRVLGLSASLGREPASYGSGPEVPTPPAVMISHALWQRQFGGSRDVLGRTVRINDHPVEIVGVGPPRFAGTEGGSDATVWLPLASYAVLQRRSSAIFASYDSLFLNAAARLRPGSSAAVAGPTVALLAERALARVRASERTGRPSVGALAWGADVVPMLSSNARVSQRRDLMLSGAVSGSLALLVLTITCANVSALLVGVSGARRREVGVRLSLGAPRKRLVRQLLTESVLLSLLAGAIALSVTLVGIRSASALLPDVQFVVDTRVTAVTCVVALITGVLYGMSPALHATRVSLAETLKGTGSTAPSQSRLQSALVVGQIALTQPLLLVVGVVIAPTFSATDYTNSRVADRVAEIELDAWAGRISFGEREALISSVVERVAAVPGVVAAMPMQSGTIKVPVAVHPADRIAGVAAERPLTAQLTAAPAGYFATYDIRFVLGRDFEAGERTRPQTDEVIPMSNDRAIIGSDLAQRLFGGVDPLGRRLVLAVPDSSGQRRPMVIVGVVEAEAASGQTADDVQVYVPYVPINTGVVAWTAGPALPLLETLRRVVSAEAPQLPIRRVQTWQQREAEARRRIERASAAAAGGGMLALLLSAVGLYAVVSAGVGQRTREIGLRTALGAPRRQVVGIFFRRGVVLGVIGLALGLPLSMLAVRLVATALNLSLGSSPLVGIGVSVVVLAVAALASWIPAHRAGGIDPILALRAD